MLKLLKQRLGKVMTKDGKCRIQIEDKILFKMGLTDKYDLNVDKEHKTLTIKKSDEGKYKVTICNNGKRICIDKNNEEIREILSSCEEVRYSFYMDENTPMVFVEGIRKTADKIKEEGKEKERSISSLTFCAGAGVSSYAEKAAGFKKVAFCEYNPEDGKEDKFSSLCEENFPDAVCFNVPLENLRAEDIPYADVWSCTLPCNDYSNLASWKSYSDLSTMNLFMYIMKFFWEKPLKERPKALLFENVPQFEKIAGNSLALTLQKEGYHITKQVIDSLDFGARTKRERFYMVACVYDGFTFPEPTGAAVTPIASDGVMTVDNLNWITPEDSVTLKNFIGRSKDPESKRHKIKTYDITKDAHIGTIIKNHAKLQPKNIIRHPTDPDKYAFIMDTNHLRYLHSIPEDFYLGNSKRTEIEAIGQGVDCKTVYAIAKKLYDFLKRNMFYKYSPSF